jgi:hypothetical protein
VYSSLLRNLGSFPLFILAPFRFFGIIQRIFGKIPIMGIEGLMAAIDNIVADKKQDSRLRALRLNPAALVDLKTSLAYAYRLGRGATGLGSAEAKFHFGAADYHYHVAAREGASAIIKQYPMLEVFEGEPKRSLWDLIGRMIPTRPGWVSCLHRHDSNRVDGYLM